MFNANEDFNENIALQYNSEAKLAASFFLKMHHFLRMV